eukprot:1000276-Alexandrium_andersonii.AAC.1
MAVLKANSEHCLQDPCGGPRLAGTVVEQIKVRAQRTDVEVNVTWQRRRGRATSRPISLATSEGSA